MKKEKQHTIVLWTKRLLGLLTFLVWWYIILTIAQSPAPFVEQAPYCMASTMLIFGLLSAAFKGLEYWGIRRRK